jgi:hypothetical protein
MDDLTKALFMADIKPDGKWECGACGKLLAEADYAAHVLTHRQRRCVLCDRPLPADYDHVTCEACIKAGKLL